jgi:hypothetical protein
MRLGKRFGLSDQSGHVLVHVVDFGVSPLASVCEAPVDHVFVPDWIDRRSVSCPACRTHVTNWLLGFPTDYTPRSASVG